MDLERLLHPKRKLTKREIEKMFDQVGQFKVIEYRQLVEKQVGDEA